MRPSPGNDLILGRLPGRSKSLGLSRTERDKHLYICGGTGTGKSKFLENLIRQDISNWFRNEVISKTGRLEPPRGAQPLFVSKERNGGGEGS